MQKNYYEILGVDKKATEKDIKKAYKKLCIKWHPDKWVNGTEDEKKIAEEKIKEINEAYDVLSDKEKRNNYDNYGDPNGRQNVSWGDFMGDFWGNHQKREVRGSDCNIRLHVTLEDIYNGINKKIKYHKLDICSHCYGNGYTKGGEKTICPECNGTGIITKQFRQGNSFFQQQTYCTKCNGRGHIIKNPCPHCQGSGFEKREVEYEITVPKGIDNGMYFTIPEQGNICTEGFGRNGDLNIVIQTIPHEKYERQASSNLLLTQKVNLYDALLGTTIEVNCIDGSQVKFNIPQLTPNGKIFRISGKGMPIMDSFNNSYGDMYVKIEYEMPNTLNNEQKELIEKIKEIDKK